MTKDRRAKQEARRLSELMLIPYRDALEATRDLRLIGASTGLVNSLAMLRYLNRQLQRQRSRPNPRLFTVDVSQVKFLTDTPTEEEFETNREIRTIIESLSHVGRSLRIATFVEGDLFGEPGIISSLKVTVKEEAPKREEPVIWELGEHGGHWFVEGTTDRAVALEILERWLYETDPDNEYEMDSIRAKVARDWYWKPLDLRYIEEEAELCRVSTHGPSTFERPSMEGIFLTEY